MNTTKKIKSHALLMDEDCHVLIVGAGIAGLYSGVQLLRDRPGLKVVIVEKYKTLGGRVITFRGKEDTPAAGMHWENGAGRIHKSHKRVRRLLRDHGLHLAPISAESGFILGPGYGIEVNDFEDLIGTYLAPLRLLGRKTLGGTTLGRLLEEVHGSSEAGRIIEKFPYYAEMWVQRADMALEALCTDLGSRSGFGVCVEGLGTLIKALADTFRGLGGEIVENCEVSGFLRADSGWTVEAACRRKWNCNQLILAIHASAARRFSKSLRSCGADAVIDATNLIRMERLLRIYAIYPSGAPILKLPRLITPNGLRYIIPVDPERGVVMISYTEGEDTEPWWDNAVAAGDKTAAAKKALKRLTRDLIAAVDELFPGVKNPAPIFVKAHPWTSGCSYWIPGDYDPLAMAKAAMNPVPGLYVCGESWSMHQAWMEGALESADEMLSTFNG